MATVGAVVGAVRLTAAKTSVELRPSLGSGQGGVVTGTDLAAFDAIGGNLNRAVVDNTSFAITTAQIAEASVVPQPPTWTLLIGGFAMLGSMVRRPRGATTTNDGMEGRATMLPDSLRFCAIPN